MKNLQKLLFATLLLVTAFADQLIEEDYGEVTYGSMSDSFATINIRNTGKLVDLRLEHVSGKLGCKLGFFSWFTSDARSYWGCDQKIQDLKLMTVVTRANSRRVILPVPETTPHDEAWNYYLPGSDVDSDSIHLLKEREEVNVFQGEKLRIWYSKDLLNNTSLENFGEHTVRITAKIRIEKDPSFRQVVTTHPSLRVGAKGDSFATITMKVSGYLKSLRLTHKDGLLTCSIYSPKENSAYWGCKNQPDFRMMILVTRMNNDVIMPRKDLVNFNSYMAYDLPGYTVDSDEIVFDGADYIKVEKDEQLRIWFSEDLMKYTTSDNEGEILIDAVSTVIRQIRPERKTNFRYILGREVTGKSANPKNCQNYVEHRYRTHSCPKKMYFDGKKQECVPGHQVSCSASPKTEQLGEVCYSADRRSFGAFKIQTSGTLLSITLRHKTGKIECPKSNQDDFWGCSSPTSNEMEMATVITTSDNHVLLPKSGATNHTKRWSYTLPGYSSTSLEIVFSDPSMGILVNRGEELKIRYSEKWLTANTQVSGRHCVNVEVIIVEDLSRDIPSPNKIQDLRKICKGKEGYVSSPTSCSHYIDCHQNQLACPDGELFDADLNRCVAAPDVRCRERPIVHHHGVVCYGPSRDQFGTFQVHTSGELVEVELQHVSGSLNCNRRKEEDSTGKWGCNFESDEKRLSTIVTRKDNQVIFPTLNECRCVQCTCSGNHYLYKLPDIAVDDSRLVFTGRNIFVKREEEFKIVFARHIRVFASSDNDKKHCVGVKTKIVRME